VTLQVDPEEQETLPPSPTVMSQVDPWSQATLHEWPQVPEHVLPIEHSNEQLDEVPHALEVKSQDVPAAHLQLLPEHWVAPP
jgi:hypothetical protein